MKAEHIETGRKGELLAMRLLQVKQYQILERNFRYKKAEIDIIASKDGIIIFVEVKTRKNNDFGEPEQFITDHKIDLLYCAACQFMQSIDYEGEIRFDVISVLYSNQKNYSIKHIEDAFIP